MELDEVLVKDCPGVCRCCLSEGCYKDLAVEYTWMGDNEIYADMLLECFDISVSQQMDGPNGQSRLICEVCITRLRDACNFKKQVVESEKKFIDMIGRGEFRKVIQHQATLKVEKLEPPLDDSEAAEVEYFDAGDLTDDEVLANLASTSRAEAPPAVAKRGRGRPRKVKDPEPKVKKVSERGVKPKASRPKVKRSPSTEMAPKQKMAASPRASIIRNLQILLNHTNATPFKWYGNNYNCFFCETRFIDVNVMKNHLRTEHEGFSSISILRHACDYNRETKIEITDLECKECAAKIPEYEMMTRHLIDAHGLNYDTTIRGLILPFILTKDLLECLECGEKFLYFMPLLIHVNKEHCQGAHMCSHCARRFSFAVQLEKHIEREHVNNRPHKCDHCDKSFSYIALKKAHEASRHNKSLLKCTKCDKEFTSFYLRKRHMLLEHESKNAFPCKECGKTFIYRNFLIRHQKLVHGNGFHKVMCKVCGEMFSDYYLKRHMVTHSDARPHACDICDKTFRRNKTLKVHLKTHLK